MPLLSDLLTVLSLFFTSQTNDVPPIEENISITPITPSNSSTNHHNHYSKSTIPTKVIGVDVYGNNVNMPLVGAGTWQYNDTVAYQSVCQAFKAGYTLIDTAFGYRNQQGVGQAIQDCYNNKRGTREDLFVITKIPGGLHASEALALHQENLQQLQLTYVDHLMVHYPSDWSTTPTRANKNVRQEEWLALENMYYRGLARSIGVSHYCPNHIDDVMEIATVTPAINQVEYHVGSGDVNGVIEKCRQSNITFMSFSPLCGPCETTRETSLIDGKLVTEIAKQHNVTGSQVSLRFIVQQALEETSFIGGVIPKSNNAEHIALNRDLFDFELTKQDMARLFAANEPAGEQGDCNVP